MVKFDASNLRGDIYGGITAGVVALPLALALGVASGAGAIAGLYGAIIVGFFAALFGGTGSQITGPTGPMVVVFAGVFAQFSGDPTLIAATVVLAGLLQIVFGITGIGNYIRLVPYPVISGFMSGIGCIIIILQLAPLMGDPAPSGPLAALGNLPDDVTHPSGIALLLGGIAMVTVFTWPSKWGKILPAPLAALIIGTTVGLLIPGAPLLGDIPSGLPSLTLPSLGDGSTVFVLKSAFILALLGAIDSLLTSLVADNMTRTRHNSGRELVGQGIGNAVAGLFGALPSAGATMRTVVNIRTGGRTRLSGMIHAALLFAVVLGLGPLASQIPSAVLAGILVKVGYDIIDWTYLRKAHRGPRWDLLLMLLVLSLTVFVDLITAVAAGVVLAALAFVKQLADQQLASLGTFPLEEALPEEADILDRAGRAISVFEFSGPLSFGAVADLGHQVREKSRDGSKIIVLDFSRVGFLDVSAARAVETIACDARHAGKYVFLSGANAGVVRVLAGLNADHCILPDNRYPNRLEALRAAAAALDGSEIGGEVIPARSAAE